MIDGYRVELDDASDDYMKLEIGGIKIILLPCRCCLLDIKTFAINCSDLFLKNSCKMFAFNELFKQQEIQMAYAVDDDSINDYNDLLIQLILLRVDSFY